MNKSIRKILIFSSFVMAIAIFLAAFQPIEASGESLSNRPIEKEQELGSESKVQNVVMNHEQINIQSDTSTEVFVLGMDSSTEQELGSESEAQNVVMNHEQINIQSDTSTEVFMLGMDSSEEALVEKAPEKERALLPEIKIEFLRLPSGPVNINSDIVPKNIVLSPSITGPSVTVYQVTSQGPGWLVFHEDDNGAPGDIIGYATVNEGFNPDIVIHALEEFGKASFHAMLHVDQGIIGQLEYPNGPDTPVYVGSEVINEPIALVTN